MFGGNMTESNTLPDNEFEDISKQIQELMREWGKEKKEEMLKNGETRNSKELMSFVDFCIAHPELRFFQALCVWSGWRFVLVTNDPSMKELYDTFAWEERQAPR